MEAINPELQAEIQAFANHAALRARSQDDLIEGVRLYAEKLLGEPVTVNLSDAGLLSVNVSVTGRSPG